jgi:hypothetical protein
VSTTKDSKKRYEAKRDLSRGFKHAAKFGSCLPCERLSFFQHRANGGIISPNAYHDVRGGGCCGLSLGLSELFTHWSYSVPSSLGTYLAAE